ncbi:MAG: hypothetical protein ACLQPD_13330 [Desulfomonilaceae bacterium]
MDYARIEAETTVSYKGVETKNWYAWYNTMPPGPTRLYVIGDVQVGNPGVLAVLKMHEPQGINPKILMLDLTLAQRPGYWPQIVTTAHARYDEKAEVSTYTSVSILCEGEIIADVTIEIVT